MEKIHHPKKVPFEYSQITSQIYLGTNQCCQTHFKESLLKKGVRADISLERERLDKPFGVDYYLWLPTKDKTPPTFKQLSIGVNHIKSLIKNKIKIYIHCKNGHGRAPTLTAAYLITLGKTTEQALNFIKKKRPVIHPTKSQITALKNFERKIK